MCATITGTAESEDTLGWDISKHFRMSHGDGDGDPDRNLPCFLVINAADWAIRSDSVNGNADVWFASSSLSIIGAVVGTSV